MDRKNRTDEFYDSGCIALIEAVVKQAAKDYLQALRSLKSRKRAARIRETAGFFRSAYFRRLTGMNGNRLLEQIRKEEAKK